MDLKEFYASDLYKERERIGSLIFPAVKEEDLASEIYREAAKILVESRDSSIEDYYQAFIFLREKQKELKVLDEEWNRLHRLLHPPYKLIPPV